jgi:DNA processing protein
MYSTRLLIALQQLSRVGFPGVGAVTARRIYAALPASPATLTDDHVVLLLEKAYRKVSRLPYYTYRLYPITLIGIYRAFDLADKIIERSRQEGITCIGCEEASYPVRLRTIPDKPLVLYVKGDVALLEQRGILALLGAGAPPPKLESFVRALANHCLPSGLGMVSGLAQGGNALGHRAWLDAGGRPIAVFGGGLCPTTPMSTVDLAYEILDKGGCWVSEYALDTAVQGEQVRHSRRLQTGLASTLLGVDERYGGFFPLATQQDKELKRLYEVSPGQITLFTAEGKNWGMEPVTALATQKWIGAPEWNWS